MHVGSTRRRFVGSASRFGPRRSRYISHVVANEKVAGDEEKVDRRTDREEERYQIDSVRAKRDGCGRWDNRCYPSTYF